MLKHWYNRFQALKHVHFEGKEAHLFFDKNVWFRLEENAKIVIQNGLVRIGYDFPNKVSRPSYNKTTITLRENAVLFLGGGVHICPGTSIYLGKNAEMTFKGRNWIGNNCTFICTKKLELGQNTSLSWQVTLIDDDGRTFYKPDGNPIESNRRPLIIGENVGLQMHVVIPKGVIIGKNSVVGANTVVRRDIPENCLVYQNPELKIRHDTTVGFQNLE